MMMMTAAAAAAGPEPEEDRSSFSPFSSAVVQRCFAKIEPLHCLSMSGKMPTLLLFIPWNLR
jgi:hypothetical protein